MFLCLLKVLICASFILWLILVTFADVREERITLKSVWVGEIAPCWLFVEENRMRDTARNICLEEIWWNFCALVNERASFFFLLFMCTFRRVVGCLRKRIFTMRQLKLNNCPLPIVSWERIVGYVQHYCMFNLSCVTQAQSCFFFFFFFCLNFYHRPLRKYWFPSCTTYGNSAQTH